MSTARTPTPLPTSTSTPPSSAPGSLLTRSGSRCRRRVERDGTGSAATPTALPRRRRRRGSSRRARRRAPRTDDVANPSAARAGRGDPRWMDAAVVTDVPAAERAGIAAEIAALSARLRAVDVARRATAHSARRRHAATPHERGLGALNPHAPLVEFIDLPAAPPRHRAVQRGGPRRAARSPRRTRAHRRACDGGPVMSVLDEALGSAVTVAGASGMTVEITVRLRAGVPIGAPVDLRGGSPTAKAARHGPPGSCSSKAWSPPKPPPSTSLSELRLSDPSNRSKRMNGLHAPAGGTSAVRAARSPPRRRGRAAPRRPLPTSVAAVNCAT